MSSYEHGGQLFENIRLDFSVSVNPLGIPESARRAYINYQPDFAKYPDMRCKALRLALSEKHGLAPENIICGNGASELIHAICSYARPRLALTLAPTFSEYERSVRLFGGEARDYGFEKIQDADMIFYCNPNNPTGSLTDFKTLCEIAEECEKNNTILVIDECFIDFTHARSMLTVLDKYSRLLVLRAFTKFYSMAGLRLGTLYSSNVKLLSAISEYLPPWNVSGAAQAVGLAALDEKNWRERTLELAAAERAFMTAELTRLGLSVFESAASFLLVKSDMPLYEALLKKGIFVRNCAGFKGLDENHIRIGLKTRRENRVLLGAMKEVLNG